MAPPPKTSPLPPPPSWSTPVRDTFWDPAYRDGSFRQHWEAPGVPKELATLVDCGWLSEGDIAVDLGCGAGREALYLASRGLQVLGVDTSGVALALARRRERQRDEFSDGSPITWVKADALDLPLAAETVDLALDRGLFHLLDEPLRRRYAEEMTRVLAPGGRLLLRGARQLDEEAGLFPVDAHAVDTHFPPERFRRNPLEPVTLEAPAEDLPGHAVVVRKG